MIHISGNSAGGGQSVQRLPPVPKEKHPKQRAGGLLGTAGSRFDKLLYSRPQDFLQIISPLR